MVETGVETLVTGTEIGFDTLFAGIELEQRKNAVDKPDQIARLPVQGHLLALDLPELKQLAYHSLDTSHVLFNQADIVAARGVHGQMLFQLFQRIDNQRKRRFEVVGDIREEIDPGLGQFLHVLLLDPFQLEPLFEDLPVAEIAPDKAGGQPAGASRKRHRPQRERKGEGLTSKRREETSSPHNPSLLAALTSKT